jgi:hypothetical protein
MQQFFTFNTYIPAGFARTKPKWMKNITIAVPCTAPETAIYIYI